MLYTVLIAYCFHKDFNQQTTTTFFETTEFNKNNKVSIIILSKFDLKLIVDYVIRRKTVTLCAEADCCLPNMSTEAHKDSFTYYL